MSAPGHVQGRLNIRGLPYTLEKLLEIARQYYTKDTAVVLGTFPSLEGIGTEKAILIVRNGGEAQTVMRRRSTQTFDCRCLRVAQIVYLKGA